MLTLILTFLAGGIIGALAARNNIKKLNALVQEAKELADKAEGELKTLKAKSKKPKAPRKKPTIKAKK
jgi:hypothetical protein